MALSRFEGPDPIDQFQVELMTDVSSCKKHAQNTEYMIHRSASSQIVQSNFITKWLLETWNVPGYLLKSNMNLHQLGPGQDGGCRWIFASLRSVRWQKSRTERAEDNKISGSLALKCLTYIYLCHSWLAQELMNILCILLTLLVF